MARPKLRYIVSRDQPELYEYLAQAFSDDDSVDVILDRRQDGSDQEDESSPIEHGTPDRRTEDLSTNLRGVGWTIVRNRPSSTRGA